MDGYKRSMQNSIFRSTSVKDFDAPRDLLPLLTFSGGSQRTRMVPEGTSRKPASWQRSTSAKLGGRSGCF